MQNGKLGIGKPRSLIKIPQRLIKISQKKIRGFHLQVFGFGYGAEWKTQNEETSKKYTIPREKHMCPSNNIGGERHYSFHCTNPKLAERRKTFR